MKKRLVSMLLILAMVLTLLPAAAFAADRDYAEDQVHVVVKNTTFTPETAQAEGLEWKDTFWNGTLVDTWVTIKDGSTMMDAIVDAVTEAECTIEGAENNYISSINGLAQFDGGSKSGWMGTLNDWFTDVGFKQVDVENGDEILVAYTCSLGEDLGQSWENSSTALKSLSFGAGTLTPEFAPDTLEYTLELPFCSRVQVNAEAANKIYRVSYAVGPRTYRNLRALPLADGDVLTVAVAADKTPSEHLTPTSYKITVSMAEPTPEAVLDMIGAIKPQAELTASDRDSVETAVMAYNALADKTGISQEDYAKMRAAYRTVLDLTDRVTTVNLSMEQGNFYLILPGDVEVSSSISDWYGCIDQVQDGISVLDVLLKAHELLFGSDFTPETAADYLQVSEEGYINRVMAIDTSSFGFAVNGFCPNDGVINEAYGAYTGYSSNQAMVQEGDTVQFFFYNPEGYYGEIYTNFTHEGHVLTELTVPVREAQSFDLVGYSYMYEGCNPEIKWKPVAGITVGLLETEGAGAGHIETQNITTDDNGSFAITFQQPGTYYLAAVSDPANLTYILPRLLKIHAVENTLSYHMLEGTADYLEALSRETAPSVGSIGGEWMVMGMNMANRPVPDAYYASVYNYVAQNINDKGQLHRAKSTENSRLILALTSMGYDPSRVAGCNLLEGLGDMDFVTRQGDNGAIWALIALDSHHYEVPAGGNVTRADLVNEILATNRRDGGWVVSTRDTDPAVPSDVDMTAMALTALSNEYKNGHPKVRKIVEKALNFLSQAQLPSGGFGSWGTENAESCAQVIIALSALGIDCEYDARFLKNGSSPIDALAGFYVKDGGFRHVKDGQRDGMATEQGLLALLAYAAIGDSIFDYSNKTLFWGTDYKDVRPNDWYFESVTYMSSEELLKGVEKGRFAPNNPMTRAMLVTVLYRVMDNPSVEGIENPFTDVKDNFWYTDAILWAQSTGIVKGVTEDRFAPDKTVTREQMVSILYRLMGNNAQSDMDLSGYPDADRLSAYAVPAMKWAVENKIISGSREPDGVTYLLPRRGATRAQVATLLYNVLAD